MKMKFKKGDIVVEECSGRVYKIVDIGSHTYINSSAVDPAYFLKPLGGKRTFSQMAIGVHESYKKAES